ncbi:MAG: electron transport complex subunit RsxC [Oceanococcaceae bacterium]
MLSALFGGRKAGFPGGLKLEGHKLYGEAGRSRPAPLPAELIYPLSQHAGAAARPVVNEGDTVLRGDLLARADGLVSAAIHASTSGTIAAIEERPVPHASGLRAPCIVLKADGEDRRRESPLWEPLADPAQAVPEDLIALIREAGIVGLGGAAFPAAVKLNPRDTARVETLILNGAECEPYISCDGAAMTEDAADIAQGAALLRRLINAREVLIAIEDHNPEALAAMRAACLATGDSALQVIGVPPRYPQGGERQLIQSLTGQEVPSEGLPIDIGIVVLNVATTGAIWRAATQAEPLTERIVTVTGSGVRQPANLRVRIGTPVKDLIAACGGYTAEGSHRLLMGGPMMGIALSEDSLPIVKGSNCILVGSTDDLAPAEPALPCIRCGDCQTACPAGLLPQQLYWHSRAHAFDKAQELHLFDCIECGCCAEVCPSKIPLVQYYRFAKTEIRLADQEKLKADQARARHEFRQERLERDKREKEEARRRKREELAARQAAQKAAEAQTGEEAPAAEAGPSPAVAAAIEKAKQRRAAAEAAKAAAADAEDKEA